MKITTVEAIPLRYPFHHGGPPSGWGGEAWTEMTTLLVKVETDEGITGWGEAFGYNAIPATKAALETMVIPTVVGRDALRISELMRELQLSLHLFGRYGVPIFALSGLDIALWDIAGKATGVPLHQLIGGIARETVPTYASLLKYQDTGITSELCSEALDKGYRLIKLHESTVSEVAAARQTVGEKIPIMLDVNCVWSPKEGRLMAEALFEYDLHWLEEPIWPPENFDGLAALRAESGIRIAAGENACTAWQFQAMFEAGAVDFAQPSVTKVGGISEFLKVVTLAEIANVTVAPHSPYFGPGFLATLQLLSTLPSIEAIERFYVNLDEDLYAGALAPTGGAITVPTGPGLGLEPDPNFIEKYRE
ncbi:MAG: mandelate racemase/muconate lactonizing enzyme family protein [Alphaproteobacteria bacterium]|jgi:L-alanine-DL-glutamate epimerase-like enolase superfamily enzyme|nr:mandelate racemase/muconate lactonizing enzyme family protein [Alphaproteobacteria bacterium]MDP6238204.1 mandelate racemase/muconate lactonizing enzyme family protein [Alphaproteobacteria bacterium]MDP7173928.1 mandelate racemase/muconate lactonizing enzyme family protein [Alphaproteobacteria bacterium]MDP7233373.1 mandelate racemase/muconate lactonizing enzyme family protein [Alphaproteobacteria bacterium]MDP7487661.1 mandelate racemase/muconate lactonizing enzyme family protein [Alphaprot|tara:strand:+ start:123 stop:1214 length:1092 start_codon:yes stop_codon:yes gene_type:complete